MEVTGTVQVSHGGHACICLAPVQRPGVVHVQAVRPDVETVASWPAHTSRLPMTPKVLASSMVTVQRQLQLQAGVNGVWTAEATERLKALLAKLKRGAGLAGTPKPLLALPDRGASSENVASASSEAPAPKPVVALPDNGTGSEKNEDSSGSSSSSSDMRSGNASQCQQKWKGLMRDVRRYFKLDVKKGNRVEALWEEDLTWYTAVVEKDQSAVCDLEDLRMLRLSYQPGDLVVALFEEDYEWYNATVVQDLIHGTGQPQDKMQ
eukprot:Skav210676  [mRNA]  locus=scaffold5572:36124:41552:- [translate_table: standard]